MFPHKSNILGTSTVYMYDQQYMLNHEETWGEKLMNLIRTILNGPCRFGSTDFEIKWIIQTYAWPGALRPPIENVRVPVKLVENTTNSDLLHMYGWYTINSKCSVNGVPMTDWWKHQYTSLIIQFVVIFWTLPWAFCNFVTYWVISEFHCILCYSWTDKCNSCSITLFEENSYL